MLTTKIRAAFAPRSLGAWPTALEPQPPLARALGVEALWLKREDLAGGNKVRGLEFLFANVAPRSVFVTVGGSGSSHCLTTARCARAEGHRTALALFRQPTTEATRAVDAAIMAEAHLVMRASSIATLPWAVLRTWLAARRIGKGTPHWIPGGGADPRAVLGHCLAALELSAQLETPPDSIVVPLGTGGTAAGIALGVAALGWSTRVIAVRVAPWIAANRWRTLRLARQAAVLLERAGIERVPRSAIRVEVVNALGAGYGYPTTEGERARRLASDHGLRLEPTYGAKAFSVYFQKKKYDLRRTVFWHTFAWP
ncbi:MAG TPA: pyridoxal-phosphate dependent enzyme [Gemmatimonadales bacterium]